MFPIAETHHEPTKHYLLFRQIVDRILPKQNSYFSTIPFDIIGVIAQEFPDPRLRLSEMKKNIRKSTQLFLREFGQTPQTYHGAIPILDSAKVRGLPEWPAVYLPGEMYVKYAAGYAIFVTHGNMCIRIYKINQLCEFKHHSSYDFVTHNTVMGFRIVEYRGFTIAPGHIVTGPEFAVNRNNMLLRIWPNVQVAQLVLNPGNNTLSCVLPCGIPHYFCYKCCGMIRSRTRGTFSRNIVDDYGEHRRCMYDVLLPYSNIQMICYLHL